MFLSHFSHIDAIMIMSELRISLKVPIPNNVETFSLINANQIFMSLPISLYIYI